MRLRPTSGPVGRAAAGGVVAIVLLLAAPAFACTPKADFIANTGSAEAGAAVELTGSNWDAEGMPVKILWNQAGSDSGRVLFSVTPDAKGTFKAIATIPADAQPGFYDLTATQTRSTGDRKVAQLNQGRFQVVEAGQQPPTPVDGSQSPTAEPQPVTEPAAEATAAPQAAATTPAPAAPAAAASQPAAPAAARRAEATAGTAAATAPAAPVAADQPAAPAAAVAEPAAAPSVKSTGSDLWSGFKAGNPAAVPSLAAPVEPAPADSLAGGLALLVVGTLTLLAGVGVASIRRTRVRAQR